MVVFSSEIELSQPTIRGIGLQKLGSASSPCARAVCDEKTEESANEKAFNYIIGGYALHQSSFSEIEETKSNNRTDEYGYYSSSKSGGI